MVMKVKVNEELYQIIDEKNVNIKKEEQGDDKGSFMGISEMVSLV